ncbi:arsenate reductase (thioredoxin) [Lacticaseibacillus daqingensis]|uniref:arsenate reductase (thioredoxin) n=1 Tax=Lacticaseibacillus daqingensis TaxID=2486014 RepID=UPI000F79BB4F|nr:arsenate reductase (thioredoxin) [Lacticaseibacillus daqingensis]
MPKIYFLCTGNTCRSQMAEGVARHLLDASWTVQSAGLTPQRLNPNAVRAMAEVGLDISAQRAKPIDPTFLASADLVVTLCGDARDQCPTTPPHVTRVHWPLPDPALSTGDDATVMAVFRQVRDEISRRVAALA